MACAPAPRVHALLKKIEGRGCRLAAEPIVCEDIFGGSPAVGAFDAERRAVVMNHAVPDAFMNQAEWTRTIAHELVHAYDYCRVELDPGNCRQLACTEIRAANLSGDCNFMVEVERTKGRPLLAMGGHQRRCVARRAEKSIAMQPACAGADVKKVVDDVFVACYADTSPFSTN
jgi:inner membrane protease ATP23